MISASWPPARPLASSCTARLTPWCRQLRSSAWSPSCAPRRASSSTTTSLKAPTTSGDTTCPTWKATSPTTSTNAWRPIRRKPKFRPAGGMPLHLRGRVPAPGERVLVRDSRPQVVLAVLEAVENQGGMGVSDGFARVVGQQVLFRDIGRIGPTVILGQQVIEGLVLVRPDVFGNPQPVFFGISEGRIDVEDHAAERKQPVADHLANAEFCESGVHNVTNNTPLP